MERVVCHESRYLTHCMAVLYKQEISSGIVTYNKRARWIWFRLAHLPLPSEQVREYRTLIFSVATLEYISWNIITGGKINGVSCLWIHPGTCRSLSLHSAAAAATERSVKKKSCTHSLTLSGLSLNGGLVLEGFSLKYGNPWLHRAAETVGWNLS